MEWISVKERLPSENEEVLTFNGYFIQTAQIMWFEEDGTPKFMNSGNPAFEATYWMPLPEPPEET